MKSHLINDEDIKYCLNMAKQLSSICESKNGEVNLAKLHALLGLFNYTIQYATITEVIKKTHQPDDKRHFEIE